MKHLVPLLLVALIASAQSRDVERRLRDRLDKDRWVVARLGISGNRAFSRIELRNALKLKPRLFRKKPTFSRRSVRRDSLMLTQIYRSNGFLKVAVKTEETLRDSTRRRVFLVFHIDEGPRTIVSGVTLNGPDPQITSQLSEIIDADVDAPLQLGVMQGDMQRIENILGDQGYLESLPTYDIALNDDSSTATVLYRYELGPRIKTSEITVAGLSKVRHRVVLRELEIQEQKTLTRTVLRTSSKHLYSTDLFSFASISYDSLAFPGSPDDSSRIVTIRVAEKKFFLAELGLGYHTYERLRGEYAMSYSNLLRIGIRPHASADASIISQGIQAGLTVPWLFSLPLDFDTRIDYRHQDEKRRKSLELLFTEVTSRVGWRAKDHVRLYLTHRWKDTDILYTIRSDSLKDEVIHSAGVEIVRDTRDDVFSPRRGTYAWFTTEVAGLTGARTNQFVRTEGDVRLFVPLGPSWVVGTTLRAGLQVPYGASSEVPQGSRFFLGGSSVLRGFRQHMAGPLSDSSTALGGTFYVATNLVEVRFPLYKRLSGVAFLDVGNLWDVQSRLVADYFTAFSLGDLRSNAGLGLRLQLPIILVRTDVGFKLDRRHDESAAAFHLNIGHSF